jgi:hypothetical protein
MHVLKIPVAHEPNMHYPDLIFTDDNSIYRAPLHSFWIEGNLRLISHYKPAKALIFIERERDNFCAGTYFDERIGGKHELTLYVTEQEFDSLFSLVLGDKTQLADLRITLYDDKRPPTITVLPVYDPIN